ncbi:MAG TPA: hypothetical protein VGA31_12570 [Thermoanaerobaculia bacterium]
MAKPIVRKLLLGVLAVIVLLVAAFVWRIGPRNVFGMLRYDQRREGNLAVGHAAPDVSLYSLDGRTRVRLADEIGVKPLVIIFGSYT